ncbi:MAG: IclR family transcriptional regulator [Acetobacteraceae bacterium]|nr:IclR family transcriptional regulator [Acetobacteraceae bacterium]
MRVVKTLLQRCGEVIEFMAGSGAACRLSDVAAALELPKSATHRLLRELCALGWVEQSGADGRYALTLRFALLGHRVLQANRLPDLVQPVLDAVAAATGELVRLTIATERGLMWFAFAQGAPPGLVYQPAMQGEVLLHATANGKAYLSTLGDAAALDLAWRGGLGARRPTSRTVSTAAELCQELAETRARGYAVAMEEAEPGIVAVAVAVRPHGRDAIGTISVAGPSMRIGADRIPVLADALRAAAATLADTSRSLIRNSEERP